MFMVLLCSYSAVKVMFLCNLFMCVSNCSHCLLFPLYSIRMSSTYLCQYSILCECLSLFVSIFVFSKCWRKTSARMLDMGEPVSYTHLDVYKRQIITDHGTQFKGRKWREEMLNKSIKTYKTSIYHPSSNPAERSWSDSPNLLLRQPQKVERARLQYRNVFKFGLP